MWLRIPDGNSFDAEQLLTACKLCGVTFHTGHKYAVWVPSCGMCCTTHPNVQCSIVHADSLSEARLICDTTCACRLRTAHQFSLKLLPFCYLHVPPN